MSGMKKVDNKGFTLVEVMLSMAILALISIPLMKYFSDSLRYAAQTAEKQKATLIAQETVEFIKSQQKLVVPLDFSATAAPDPSVSPDPSASPGPAATSGPSNFELNSQLLYRFGGYATPEASGSPASSAVRVRTVAAELVPEIFTQSSVVKMLWMVTCSRRLSS